MINKEIQINKGKEKSENLFHEFFFEHNHTLPKPPWTVSDTFKMVILTGILLFGISYGALYGAMRIFDPLIVGEWFFTHTKQLMIGGVLFQVLVEILLLYWYTHKKYNVTIKDFGFRPTPTLKTLELAIVLFLLVAIGQNVFIVGMELIGIPKMGEQGILTQLLEQDMIPVWFMFVFAGIIAPVTEELIFRGFMLSALINKWGFKWGIVIGSFMFSIAHFQVQAALLLFLMGMLLSILYIRTKSLWPGIIFHSVNNTLAMVLLVMSHG